MFIKSLCNKISTVSFLCRNTKSIHFKMLNYSISNVGANACLLNNNSKNMLIYPLMSSSRSMAGHSKWQNIKYIKAEKDRQKNLLCTRYVRLVTAAIRDKGPDPKMNNKLANLIEEAKRNNVPSGTLESALKRANNKKYKPGSVEILGPGGSFIIIDFETDNICDMRHTLKVMCKKYGASIMSGEGRWRAVYEQKGIIKVTSQLNGENFETEKMLDAAIEAGAEDVQKREDENDKIFYEFISAAGDLHSVKKEVEKDYSVEEAYIGYLALTTVSLSDQDMNLANKFLDELGDLPDISRIFENIE